MIVDVYLEKALPQIDQLYSYAYDGDDDIVGKRVVVPFGRGNKTETAVVIRIGSESEFELKSILQVLDKRPILSKSAIALGMKMREYFVTSYVQAFQPLLPKYVLGGVEEVAVKLTDDEEVRVLFQGQESLPTEKIDEERLNAAVENKKAAIHFRSTKPVKKQRVEKFCAAESFNESMTDKQAAVYLLVKKSGPMTKADIMKRTGFSQSPVDSLIKKGALAPFDEKDSTPETPPVLREDQKKAIADIAGSERPFHLLYGKTGSGKTEVYMQLAERAMREGKSSLIIVPEIGLATQMVHRLSARFPGKVDILHSQRSEGEKAEAWIRLKEEPGRIVVGARSAIFSPVPALGYIFIDEEQEESYDYQEGLRYNVRDVAEMRVRLEGGKVVYGSATPSVITYARCGEDVVLHRLEGDPAKTEASPVEVVDMREELFKGNVEILSEAMVEGLEGALKAKKQAILFINRRGYSQFVSCRSCGHVIQCDACDISLVYHRRTHRLHCHYCGRTKPMPKTCPECGSEYLKQFGIGTEQVEAWIKNKFPEARVYRMDKDTMAQKGNYEKVYAAMNENKVDILVGTQMLAKGFDFENVVFVGVVAADLSLFVSDYKAQEKTYQLLTQVAGRAGRGKHKGRAVIQTYNPDNYSIQFAKDRNYEPFFHKEMEERKRFLYPPYVHLVKIHIRGTGDVEAVAMNWKKTLEAMNKHEQFDLLVANPVEQPKIKNKRHMSILAKVWPKEYRPLLKALKRVLMYYYRTQAQQDIQISLEIDG